MKLLKKIQIFLQSVVGVAGRVAGEITGDVSLHMTEGIPDGQPLAVFEGPAFGLV